MFTAVLKVNLSDDGSWDFLPQDLWLNILESFVLPHATSVGFSGVEAQNDITKIALFSDWQPVQVGEGSVTIMWKNAYGHELRKHDAFALFAYDDMVNQRLSSVPNLSWRSYDESYPVDELYFFQGEQVILIATPYEGSLMFCGLSDIQQEELLEIDARIRPNLYEMTDMIVTSEFVPI